MIGEATCACGARLVNPPSRVIEGRVQIQCPHCDREFFEDMIDEHARRLP
jgi:hypothetical protein